MAVGKKIISRQSDIRKKSVQFKLKNRGQKVYEAEYKQIPVILIIDDVEVNARLLKKMVEKMGYRKLLTATGVKEAVSQMQKELPQLILLDIMMRI